MFRQFIIGTSTSSNKLSLVWRCPSLKWWRACVSSVWHEIAECRYKLFVARNIVGSHDSESQYENRMQLIVIEHTHTHSWLVVSGVHKSSEPINPINNHRKSIAQRVSTNFESWTAREIFFNTRNIPRDFIAIEIWNNFNVGPINGRCLNSAYRFWIINPVRSKY